MTFLIEPDLSLAKQINTLRIVLDPLVIVVDLFSAIIRDIELKEVVTNMFRDINISNLGEKKATL